MTSYKEAHEKLNSTGEGFHGIEMETFQTYIIKNVCKYYFELDPVLRDRPNVYPWFTNEKKSNHNTRIKESVFLSSDSDSSDDDIELMSIPNYDETSSRSEIQNRLYSKNNMSDKNNSFSSSNSDNNQSITITSPSSTDNKSSSSDQDSSDNKRSKALPPKKLTPIEAKKQQKTALSRKRKTIASNKKGKHKHESAIEKKDRELIIESRRNKMIFEKKKHDDLKLIEAEKLLIEKERLQMEKDSLKEKQCYIRAQTNLENNKILLLKMDIYSKRQNIKRDNPEITEDDLNNLFPYPG